MTGKNKAFAALLSLSLGAYLLTTGINLSALTISNPDEPRYACAARTMLRDGEYLFPKFNEKPRLVKPILFYWVLAIPGKIGSALGLDLVTAMRIGPLLMGLLGVAETFLIARRLALNNGETETNAARAGLFAAIVLMTCNLYHKVSREIVIDITLTAIITCAWYFLLEFAQRIGKPRAGWMLLGFYVSLGLSCMAKGPLPALACVVIPVVLYLIWSRQLALLKVAGLWWGVPLALAIGGWWFLVLAQSGRQAAVDKMVSVESLNRIVGRHDHRHEYPYLWYLKVLPEILAPWIAALPFVGYWTYRQSRIERVGARPTVSNITPLQFVAFALGGGFAAFGLSMSKRQLYLLPLLPYFAIWVGIWWMNIEQNSRSKLALVAGRSLFAAALLYALGDSTILTNTRETEEDRIAFFAAIDKQLAGRRVATFGESANEAVWFLDRKETISNLTRPKLEKEFFQTPNMVLLVKEAHLGRTPAIAQATRKALKFEFERKRGTDTYYLAVPSGITPDPSIFIGKGKDKEPEVDGGEE